MIMKTERRKWEEEENNFVVGGAGGREAGKEAELK